MTLEGKGKVEVLLGRDPEALHTFEDWIALHHGHQLMVLYPDRTAETVEVYATLLRERRQPDEAARIEEWAEEVREAGIGNVSRPPAP